MKTFEDLLRGGCKELKWEGKKIIVFLVCMFLYSSYSLSDEPLPA